MKLLIFVQQKLARKDGTPLDRSRDIEHLWEFYQRYKRRNRVDDIQKEEQKWRESGTFSANLGEYVLHMLVLVFSILLVSYHMMA